MQIAGYLSPDYKRALRLIQVSQEQSLQALLAEALNLLFEQHNLPRIAGE